MTCTTIWKCGRGGTARFDISDGTNGLDTRNLYIVQDIAIACFVGSQWICLQQSAANDMVR